MITEIGGLQEAQAAQYARDHMYKADVHYIAGLTPPRVTRWAMPEPSSPPSGSRPPRAEKVQLMRERGVTMVKLPSDFGTTVPKVLRR